MSTQGQMSICEELKPCRTLLAQMHKEPIEIQRVLKHKGVWPKERARQYR
jgi:hypothetical protein